MRLQVIIFFLMISTVITSAAPKQSEKIEANKAYAYDLGMEAIKLMNKGKYQKALKLLDRAVKLDKTSMLFPYEKALTFYKLQEYKKTINILDSMLNIGKRDDKIYQLLGNSYDFIAEKKQAMETYKMGLIHYPESARLYMEMGIAELGANKEASAVSFWERGIAVKTSFPDTYYHLAVHYSSTDEKIWSIFYGENFINLSNNLRKFEQIGKIIFDTMLEFNKDPKKIKIKTPNTFIESISSVYKQSLNTVKSKFQKDFKIYNIYLLRTQFIKEWFKNGYDKKYPNNVFDWHKKLIDQKKFLVYNYALMGKHSLVELRKWYKKNFKEFNAFADWKKNNTIMITKEKYFIRELYK